MHVASCVLVRLVLRGELDGALRLGCLPSVASLLLSLGCSDNVGPLLGAWPGGITSQLAFVKGDTLYRAVSSEKPPWAIAPLLSDTGGLTWPLEYVRIEDISWNPKADTLAVSFHVPVGVSSAFGIWYVEAKAERSSAGLVTMRDTELYATWAPDGRLGSCRSLNEASLVNLFLMLGGTAVFRGCSGHFDVLPDGHTVALSRVIEHRDTLGYFLGYTRYTVGLFVVDLADTSAARLLAVDTVLTQCPGRENCGPPPSLNPTVSPGGDQIAFVRRNRSGTETSIWLVGPDGSGLRQLTSGPQDAGPVGWSRDGAWLMLRRGEDQMVALRPDGSDELRLLTVPGGIRAFAWSRQ